jgi:hypothetical protein
MMQAADHLIDMGLARVQRAEGLWQAAVRMK